jgi:hypothetical protein
VEVVEEDVALKRAQNPEKAPEPVS